MTNTDSNRFPIDRNLLARLFTKIKISENSFYKGVPCWEWQASLDDGYGQTSIGRKRYTVHRLFYQMFVELIGSSKIQCDHLCRNRKCANPVHIELVSIRENIMRGIGFAAKNAAKTHCPKGHPYSGDNLRIRGHGRLCKTCEKAFRVKHSKAKRIGKGIGSTNRNKTHCKNGHELAGKNLRLRHRIRNGKERTERGCNECLQIAARNGQQRHV